MRKVMMMTVLCLLAAALIPAQSMMSGNGFDLAWETREGQLIVTLTAPTTGWLAFGTDATNKMKDANIILVWVDDATGIAMGEDHFGTGMFSHRADMQLEGSQDLQVLSGTQTQEETTVVFSIPLDSGDSYDTALQRGRTYPLLLAAGKTDNIRKKHNRVFTGEITIP